MSRGFLEGLKPTPLLETPPLKGFLRYPILISAKSSLHCAYRRRIGNRWWRGGQKGLYISPNLPVLNYSPEGECFREEAGIFLTSSSSSSSFPEVLREEKLTCKDRQYVGFALNCLSCHISNVTITGIS